MSFIEKIRQPILAELQEFENVFNTVLKSDNTLLSNVHEYVMQGHGKKMRPILTILAAKLFGEINKATLYGAFSLELLHTASLVHDDVVDDTMERRGRPSVNAKWTNKVAVLSGDYILSKSLHSATVTHNLRILEAIATIGMILPDGELLQLANTEQAALTEEKYLDIIKRKTAMLFATCTEVGGLSVNVDEQSLNHLKKYGEYLGMCFQIKDDIFDYYEDAQVGKPTGNDVRDGKLTLPLIFALRNTNGTEKDEIVKMISNKDFSTENINKIMQFAHDNGGVEYAISRMNDFKKLAIEELMNLPDNEIRISLIEYLEFVADRDF
ncbi:MAG: Polyprenyl synthetase [Bacteroidetes bacterium]|nr:Polyprenyl synthetase [Bacteroidota bacterium]